MDLMISFSLVPVLSASKGVERSLVEISDSCKTLPTLEEALELDPILKLIRFCVYP